MVLLSGSKVYTLVTGYKEKELERWILRNVAHIFGEDVLYFDVKKQIESIIGTRTIPDGYLIRLSDPPVFMVIECELSSHDPYRHTLPQLTKFDVAIKNVDTQRKLADLFYEEIRSDKEKLEKVKNHLGKNEVYHYIHSVLKNIPHYLILIDEVLNEYHEIADRFPANTTTKSFKTYRSNSGDIIHEFDPVFKKTIQIKSLTVKDKKKLDQRIRSMMRTYIDKRTSAWRSFPPNLRESLQIRGMELVKHRDNDEVILLVYLDSSIFKASLVDQGYTEWFSDHSDGDWYGHKESPNSNTHPVLLRTTHDKLDLDEIKQSVYRLISVVKDKE
jgi:hypothetical protein